MTLPTLEDLWLYPNWTSVYGLVLRSHTGPVEPNYVIYVSIWFENTFDLIFAPQAVFPKKHAQYDVGSIGETDSNLPLLVYIFIGALLRLCDQMPTP
jgi:hypothetical protein